MSKLRKIDAATVRESIKKLLCVFCEKQQKVFKTESDIKCYLYHLLMKSPLRECIIRTEMPKNGKKHDIVIFEGSEQGDPIAIEIKFDPEPGKSLKKGGSKNDVYEDINKLEAINANPGYLVILSYKECNETFKARYNSLNLKKNISKKQRLFLFICHATPKRCYRILRRLKEPTNAQ